MNLRPLLHFVPVITALFFTACASAPPVMPPDPRRPGVPPETGFDRGLSTDRVLCLSLQGEHGERWRFIVDTGSPVTIVDQSLRPKLSASQGTEGVQYAWSGSAVAHVHDPLHLFLNGTLLLTGPHVWSDDLRRIWQGRGVDGILGMDCLRNYCVQFDFRNHSVRFLDPERTTGPKLGRAFPLYAMANGVFVQADLLGAGPVLYQVDTGCTPDAVMKPPVFDRACQRQAPEWMRQLRSGEGRPVVEAGFAQGAFNGETYEKFIIDSANHNFLGLHFLARHVVTLNFPKHTMYLRRY